MAPSRFEVPSRSYAAQGRDGPYVRAGGELNGGGRVLGQEPRDRDDVSRRRPQRSLATSTNILPSFPPAEPMFLVKAPPIHTSISSPSFTYLQQSAVDSANNLPLKSLGAGGDPNDNLVLPSTLFRGQSAGTVPTVGSTLLTAKPAKPKTRYHGPTLASPPVIMGTPGYGISNRDPKTGMTEAERYMAMIRAGEPLPAAGDPQAQADAIAIVATDVPSLRPKKKKKRRAQQVVPVEGGSAETPASGGDEDPVLSFPGHSALGVIQPGALPESRGNMTDAEARRLRRASRATTSRAQRRESRRARAGGVGGGGVGGLLRGASMRRTNVWDEVPEPEAAEEQLEPPPSFPYPTPSTTRLPPTYHQASAGHSTDDPSRPRSPPPSFDVAISQTFPARDEELETVGEEEEGITSGEEGAAVPPKAETVISESASSVAPENETPSLRKKRTYRMKWNEDIKEGFTLEERILRDLERRHEKPEPIVETLLPREEVQERDLEVESAAEQEQEQEVGDDTQAVEEEDLKSRYSKEEKGKGRAVDLDSVAETRGSSTDGDEFLSVRGGSLDGRGETPSPPDAEEVIATPPEEEEVDEEGARTPTAETMPQKEVQEFTAVAPSLDSPMVLGEVIEPPLPVVAEPDAIAEAVDEVTPMPAPLLVMDGSGTPPAEVSQATPPPSSPTAPVTVSAPVVGRPRNNSTMSRFVEDLPEVTGMPPNEAQPLTASPTKVTNAPLPPVKEDITQGSAPPPTSATTSGPRPLFRSRTSDNKLFKSDNPWAFMRKLSVSSKAEGDDGSPPDSGKATDVDGDASEQERDSKRSDRVRKLSRLANQLFRPNLGLPAESPPLFPLNGQTTSPPAMSEKSAGSEGLDGPGVMVEKPAAVDVTPSRQAALARRDLLASTPSAPSVPSTPSAAAPPASSPSSPPPVIIHPFNRAVKPAWMANTPAKFSLYGTPDSVISKYQSAETNGESTKPRLNVDIGARNDQSPYFPRTPVRQESFPPPRLASQSVEAPESTVVHQAKPIPQAVNARRRPPPAVPQRNAIKDEDSSSSEDGDTSDSEDDDSSSYEWSISDVVPRRSAAYRLLPPRGLPAEVLRGPDEPPNPHRSAGHDRVRPRGPRERGAPPPLPPRPGRPSESLAQAARPTGTRPPPPPPAAPLTAPPPLALAPVAPLRLPVKPTPLVPVRTQRTPSAESSLLQSPLLKPPVQRKETSDEIPPGILEALIPSKPAPKARPPAPPLPAPRRSNGKRPRDPPPLRPGRLILKPRFDDRPENEMKSQLAKRVNKWRVDAIGAEVQGLVDEPEDDVELEPVVSAPPITHSRSVPNLGRTQTTQSRPSPPSSPRPQTTASNPGPSHEATSASPDLREAESGPSTRRDLEYTDLDLAVAQAAADGRDLEAMNEVTAFLENAGNGASADELADLLIAPVELESRRTTKDGKVKLKLTALGVRVTKCAICQLQYKEGNMLGMLPNCGHTGHQKCIVGWLRADARCMICRAPLRS